MSRRAVLIREAQQVAAHHSSATGDLLESLVREVSVANAGRVLALVRRLEAEAGPPADAGHHAAGLLFKLVEACEQAEGQTRPSGPASATPAPAVLGALAFGL
jgi:hypothetical protein